MKEKVLVTGINGFVGGYVVKELAAQGYSVIGASRQPGAPAGIDQYLDAYTQADLLDSSHIDSLPLGDLSAIINLAGMASVSGVGDNGDKYKDVNVKVHTNLYEKCLEVNPSVHIIAVSSGAVYSIGDNPLPLTEKSGLKALSDTNSYAVSKIMMEQAVRKLTSDKGLRAVIARPFNHTGPGQQSGYVAPDMLSRLRESIEKRQPLKVGNLENIRDFTDVRDIARAYVSMVKGFSSLNRAEYNICSGKSVSLDFILQHLIKASGITRQEITIERDEKFIRADANIVEASAGRLIEATSWQPQIDITQTLDDLVKY